MFSSAYVDKNIRQFVYSCGFIVGTKADIIYLMCCDIIFFTIAAIFVLLGSLASLRIISNLIAITV